LTNCSAVPNKINQNWSYYLGATVYKLVKTK